MGGRMRGIKRPWKCSKLAFKKVLKCAQWEALAFVVIELLVSLLSYQGSCFRCLWSGSSEPAFPRTPNSGRLRHSFPLNLSHFRAQMWFPRHCARTGYWSESSKTCFLAEFLHPQQSGTGWHKVLQGSCSVFKQSLESFHFHDSETSQ